MDPIALDTRPPSLGEGIRDLTVFENAPKYDLIDLPVFLKASFNCFGRMKL